MMLWIGLALLAVGVAALVVIARRWHRWGFADDMARLTEATEAAKVEMGTALLPPMQALGRAMDKAVTDIRRGFDRATL